MSYREELFLLVMALLVIVLGLFSIVGWFL